MSDFWDNIESQCARITNEASVETLFLLPLLRTLGYADTDISAKHPVVFQEGRAGRKPEADFVVFSGPIWNLNTSLIVVEAKAPGQPFDGAKKQGESYAFNTRAPFLLLCDGARLQLWQLQSTTESGLLIDITVGEICANRGRIEALMGKESAIAYCATLTNKNMASFVDDLSSYENSELLRTAKDRWSTARTLRNSANQEYGSETLLTEFPDGSIVVAPSGYGKTVLSVTLFRKAIESRRLGASDRLAIDMPLPDLAETGAPALEFIKERLDAHHPGFTEGMVKELSRKKGLLLVCDGFDRISREKQKRLEVELKNLRRDFPNVQIFVFSRSTELPALGLPTLTLEKFSVSQRSDVIDTVSAIEHPHIFLHSLPQPLVELSFVPLVFRLLLDFWLGTQKHPTQIASLFRHWLDTLLLEDGTLTAQKIIRESALGIIAASTTDGPISRRAGLALLKDRGFTDSVFDELLHCGAIFAKGETVELRHDSLGDYLRATDLIKKDEADLFELLQIIPLEKDSLFPILLTAILPTYTLQKIMWKRLPRVDLNLYLNALRYRADLSQQFTDTGDRNDASQRYLQEILEGIQFPLEASFPLLRLEVSNEIAASTDGNIEIVGQLQTNPAMINFQLRPSLVQGGQALVGELLEEWGYRHVNLTLSQWRLDSGRLLGTEILRDGLLEVIGRRGLKGGPIWTMERVLGRVKYLSKEYGLPIGDDASLQSVAEILAPDRTKIVMSNVLSKGPAFAISEVLQDIDFLQKNSHSQLESWWKQCGLSSQSSESSEKSICLFLNEHYRRLQLAYKEVVDSNFSAVSGYFGFYNAMPVRWTIVVVRHTDRGMRNATVYPKWFPVETWNEIGADVSFSSTAPQWHLDRVGFDELEKEISKFGRNCGNTYRNGGFHPMPWVDGMSWLSGFDGETSVMREVSESIDHQIKSLFSSLPGQD